MYENLVVGGFEPVTFSEIGRAMIWMDVGLVLFTIGSLIATKMHPTQRQQMFQLSRKPPIVLNRKIVLYVCCVCFPVGVIFFILKRSGSAVDLGDFGQTAYSSLFTMWPLAVLAMGVYFLGFKWWLMLPLLGYLGVVGLQGYHRFMLLLPILLLVNIYLFRNNRRWPPMIVGILGIVLFAIFPYLKYIGQAFKEGDTRMIQMLLTQGSSKVLTGDKDTSQDFLDQFACAMTLVDRHGKVYYGAGYVALLTYPIPRAFWPDKPTVVQFLIDIETEQRPMKKEGRIVTLMGDAYVNFREPGMIIYPLTLGFILSWWSISSSFYPHESLRRFMYIIFAPALIQVWRDGLTSLVFFTVVHFMPVFFIATLHLIPSFRGKYMVQRLPGNTQPLKPRPRVKVAHQANG